jgi:hypothetical protein
VLWHLPWPAPAVPSLKHSNLAPADNIQKTPGRSPNFNLHGYSYPYKEDNDTLQQMIAADNTKFLAGSVWGRSNWIY